MNSDTKAKNFNQTQFAKILNDIIKKRGIKKQEFAQEAGIRSSNLSRYLTGKLLQPPHFASLERIANVSENPDAYFSKLLEASGYSMEDYKEYQKREQQKLSVRRKTEDEIWETCSRLVKMSEKELKEIFGCPSVSSVMHKFKYHEVISILYANYANARIGLIARRKSDDDTAAWGVVTSWKDGIYRLLMGNGKSIAVPEAEMEWHPQQISLKTTGFADVAECLSKINGAT